VEDGGSAGPPMKTLTSAKVIEAIAYTPLQGAPADINNAENVF